MLAIVAEGVRGRCYLPPTREHELIANSAHPDWRPAGDVPSRLTGGTCVPYGLREWGDLFTPRQLVALNTLSDLVSETMEKCEGDANASGFPSDPRSLEQGGKGALAYAQAVRVYLVLAISKVADAQTSLCRWKPTMDQSIATFGRQAIPMVWDFSEAKRFRWNGWRFPSDLKEYVEGPS